jgi:hypothetical protein
MAAKGKRIHPEIEYKPHMQEDDHRGCLSSVQLFIRLLRRVKNSVFQRLEEPEAPPVSPTKQHNHRSIRPLQSVVRASKTGVDMFKLSKLTRELKNDRSALERFFQDTHHEDDDWCNKETGSGRLYWLDKDRDIGQWQGVVVYDEKCELKGRLWKLQLSKNSISGMFEAHPDVLYSFFFCRITSSSSLFARSIG